MELVKGLVVRARAGRDKDVFFILMEVQGQNALICDGKRRSLEHPKKKNVKHLAPTGVVISENSMNTNREIRKVLHSFCKSDGYEEVIPCQNRT